MPDQASVGGLAPSPPKISERTILVLVGAVHFVNLLDFMMVMPLGPDFAAGLGIPTSRLGLIGGSYTAAAAIAGMIGSLFLDRFDRRSALAVAMLGLVLGTAAGGVCTGLGTLMAARVVAGCFGGPASSLALSIVADVVPAERRGKAMGAVMGAFAVASVLGVPAGLELARRGGWRVPFFAVAGLGLVVAASALFVMPKLRLHLAAGRPERQRARDLLGNPLALLTLGATASVMMASFAIVPNLSAYLQFNAGYPRDRLGLLYLVGGVVSFVVLRLIGSLVDRFGATTLSAFGTAAFLAVLAVGFLPSVPAVPVMALFVGFMVSTSFRNVPLNTVSSKVPAPAERAGFMSVQSAVQHLAAASGAITGSQLLRELPDKKLEGMRGVAGLSMALAAALPLLLWRIEARLARRARAAPPVRAMVAADGADAPG